MYIGLYRRYNCCQTMTVNRFMIVLAFSCSKRRELEEHVGSLYNYKTHVL